MVQVYCEDHIEPWELTGSPKVKMGSDLLRYRNVWQPGLNVLNSKSTEERMADGAALVIFSFFFFFLLQVSIRDFFILC